MDNKQAWACYASEIVVSPLPDTEPQQWKVHEPIVIRIYGSEMVIPKGFVCDFASVPKFMKPLFPDKAIYSTAAVVHDHLYKTGLSSKWMADAVFCELLACAHCAWITRMSMWLGVAMFGFVAWRKHRKQDLQS